MSGTTQKNEIGNEIASIENSPASVPMIANSMNSIATMMQEKNLDPAKLHSLLDFQERLMNKQAQIDYDQALARIQSRMPRIAKNGEIKNKSGKVVARFMKYEDIDTAIRNMLAEEGFSLQHDRDEVNNKMVITTWLKHRGGHKESVKIPLPYDQPNAMKNNVQAAVSTFSYGKRVNVCSLLNIVAEDEDNDGTKSEYFPLTDEQAQEIKGILQEASASETDIKNFLTYMEADSVDEINTSDYDKAIAGLNTWKKKKAEAAAAKEKGE